MEGWRYGHHCELHTDDGKKKKEDETSFKATRGVLQLVGWSYTTSRCTQCRMLLQSDQVKRESNGLKNEHQNSHCCYIEKQYPSSYTRTRSRTMRPEFGTMGRISAEGDYNTMAVLSTEAVSVIMLSSDITATVTINHASSCGG